MREVGGFGPGFDFVRIALALGVMAWHSLAAVSGETVAGKSTPIWLAIYAILPMFFALSGFLVTGSALRLPLRDYVLNRTFRIVPALAVDIGLSALILGPVFTVVSLSAYVHGPEFWRYFFNVVGYIHYTLPGVFLDNPLHGIVNGSLWTVPYEIACYVVMSTMIALGIVRSSRWTAVLAVAWLAASVALTSVLVGKPASLPVKVLDLLFVKNGAELVGYFLGGSALYLARDRVPFDHRIAAGLVAVLAILSVVLPGDVWFGRPILALLLLPALVYLVIYFGMLPLPKVPVFDRGDYSYGVYLYHFPLLQALQHLVGFTPWYALFAAAFVPVTAMAIFSWHLIEKPILKQRKRFSLVGARLAAADAARGVVAADPVAVTPAAVSPAATR